MRESFLLLSRMRGALFILAFTCMQFYSTYRLLTFVRSACRLFSYVDLQECLNLKVLFLLGLQGNYDVSFYIKTKGTFSDEQDLP